MRRFCEELEKSTGPGGSSRAKAQRQERAWAIKENGKISVFVPEVL